MSRILFVLRIRLVTGYYSNSGNYEKTSADHHLVYSGSPAAYTGCELHQMGFPGKKADRCGYT
jgi:hypothetical protein